MKPLEQTYGEKFFKRRQSLSWRTSYVCSGINELFHPSSVVDVGCAIGDYVHEFLNMGIHCTGIEGSSDVIPYLVVDAVYINIHDLRIPINFEAYPVYDVVMCLEVAEHIEKEYADIFIQNLSKLSNTIVMSAAPIGQKGHGHYNCQPPEYWIEKVEKLIGYYFRKDLVEKLRYIWRDCRNKKAMSAYYNNLLIFTKEKGKY
jgi:hypothetical protein